MKHDTTSYHHPATGISILVPLGWEGEELAGGFRLFGPPPRGADGHRPTISFVTGAPDGYAGGAAALEGLAAETLATLRSEYAGFVLGAESRFWLSSGCRVFTREYEWSDEATGWRFDQLQAFVDADPLCRVNAAARAPSGLNMPAFRAVLRSIRFIPTEA